MGLGINAAMRKDFNDYKLSKITKYEFVPEFSTDEDFKVIKSEFSDWIIANGFREFFESFEVFLDNVNFAHLNFRTNCKEIRVDDAKKEHLLFKQKGLIKKIKRLQRNMDFKFSYFDHLNSLNIVRNCLTHRRGIIENMDLNTPDCLKVSWTANETYIEKSDGTQIIIFPPNKTDVKKPHVDKGEKISIRFVDREKKFTLNSKIKLNTFEISEILSMMTFATKEIINILFNEAKRYNVPFEKK